MLSTDPPMETEPNTATDSETVDAPMMVEDEPTEGVAKEDLKAVLSKKKVRLVSKEGDQIDVDYNVLCDPTGQCYSKLIEQMVGEIEEDESTSDSEEIEHIPLPDVSMAHLKKVCVFTV